MKMTHTAVINYVGVKGREAVRETKNFWVNAGGSKFRKKDGSASDPQSYVLCHLYLKSVSGLTQ